MNVTKINLNTTQIGYIFQKSKASKSTGFQSMICSQFVHLKCYQSCMTSTLLVTDIIFSDQPEYVRIQTRSSRPLVGHQPQNTYAKLLSSQRLFRQEDFVLFCTEVLVKVYSYFVQETIMMNAICISKDLRKAFSSGRLLR